MRVIQTQDDLSGRSFIDSAEIRQYRNARSPDFCPSEPARPTPSEPRRVSSRDEARGALPERDFRPWQLRLDGLPKTDGLLRRVLRSTDGENRRAGGWPPIKGTLGYSAIKLPTRMAPSGAGSCGKRTMEEA